ncbi:MAG TPA: metallophosphoesterase, partial [Polyangiaceae bacterium]|nr:metallophosphoesterase [Polyangiaceae bacterium]
MTHSSSMDHRIHVALERAAADATEARLAERDGRMRTRELVMGDPQAPLDKVLAVLDHHQLLGDDGRLRPEIALVSIGDHFDYGGGPGQPVADVERSGRELLAWLAAHPPDQVTLIIGNHDLGRVGELATFDDAKFSRARAAALAVHDDPALEARFLAEFPALPSSEVARRDFNGFSVAQRELVLRLLRTGRFLAARAAGPHTLLCHAGVTVDDVGPSSDAHAIAAALNERVERAVSAWQEGTPLVVPGLHQPGNAEGGEGGGVFYHRPSNPEHARRASMTGPFRRRFDARRLPLGLLQVIG